MKKLMVSLVLGLAVVACGKSAENKSEGLGASQSSCALLSPVTLKGDPLKSHLDYFNVVLDRPLKEESYFSVPSDKSNLKLSLYNIKYGTDINRYSDTGYLGIAFSNLLTERTTGFAGVYIGGFNIYGETTHEDGVTVFRTEHVLSKTRVQVIVKNNFITSIEYWVGSEDYRVKSMSESK